MYQVKKTRELFNAILNHRGPSTIIVDDFLNEDESVKGFKERVGITGNVDRFTSVIPIEVKTITEEYYYRLLDSIHPLLSTHNGYVQELDTPELVRVFVKVDENFRCFDVLFDREVYRDVFEITDFFEECKLKLL